RVAVPRVLALDAAPFHAGDVVLFAPNSVLWKPRVGQVVLYRLHDMIVPGGSHEVILIGGERIERILAGPGEHVVWDGKTLTVDGKESRLAPLSDLGFPFPVDLVVPAGHFVILPTTLGVNLSRVQGGPGMGQLYTIPSDSILGRVYWQQQPLSRFGWIH